MSSKPIFVDAMVGQMAHHQGWEFGGHSVTSGDNSVVQYKTFSGQKFIEVEYVKGEDRFGGNYIKSVKYWEWSSEGPIKQSSAQHSFHDDGVRLLGLVTMWMHLR